MPEACLTVSALWQLLYFPTEWTINHYKSDKICSLLRAYSSSSISPFSRNEAKSDRRFSTLALVEDEASDDEAEALAVAALRSLLKAISSKTVSLPPSRTARA